MSEAINSWIATGETKCRLVWISKKRFIRGGFKQHVCWVMGSCFSHGRLQISRLPTRSVINSTKTTATTTIIITTTTTTATATTITRTWTTPRFFLAQTSHNERLINEEQEVLSNSFVSSTRLTSLGASVKCLQRKKRHLLISLFGLSGSFSQFVGRFRVTNLKCVC